MLFLGGKFLGIISGLGQVSTHFLFDGIEKNTLKWSGELVDASKIGLSIMSPILLHCPTKPEADGGDTVVDVEPYHQ